MAVIGEPRQPGERIERTCRGELGEIGRSGRSAAPVERRFRRLSDLRASRPIRLRSVVGVSFFGGHIYG